jgi:hypothetical protein
MEKMSRGKAEIVYVEKKMNGVPNLIIGCSVSADETSL